jgi:hypothetical protein
MSSLVNDGLLIERDALRREMKQACITLADEFVPAAERAGAHLQGLPRLVAHAVEHHQWHHDAQDSAYVNKVEEERDALQAWTLNAVQILHEIAGAASAPPHHQLLLEHIQKWAREALMFEQKPGSCMLNGKVVR